MEGYYNSLLDVENNTDGKEVDSMIKDENGSKKRISRGAEKWKGQIEKVPTNTSFRTIFYFM